MLTQGDLGRRVNAARKAQGLTQEQLGNALGVSAQAVSKWELGESVPDTMLLPEICKSLAVTADHLLGIDDAIGIETLSRLLSDRIASASGKSQDANLMRVLRWLHMAGSRAPSLPSGDEDMRGTMVTVIRDQGRIRGTRIYHSDGLACTVLGSMWDRNVDEELLDTVRVLTSPVHWGVFEFLLQNGPQKREAIMASGVVDDAEELNAALEDLVENGIIVQRRAGYDFADDYRATAVLVVLLAMCSTGKLRMLSVGSQEGDLPTGIP
jgi:transcriptional regulator with XRE-family HTH domain